ncbi:MULTISPECIES: SDR family oxidoreductase [Mammaliicoccus]|uniref:SDR family oxidoreductase n=1 Tax=Mammaliicoccus sciuri TaxID=1296 RepID=A0AAW5LQR8_MAMSC|nr:MULTISPECIES: SDR family oxidoreductase [Mammaliicoccus]MBO1208809.1 SDR family oxidoreductase [Mammaliicoccus sciuri]MCC2088124.1 SDR family oxidoreductase [Mammaliicoccus sciuri]MCD5140519.1 SDR family oxidoreductase [Mammaliicoccus sciuri]MCD8762419.1 SDR family oxidoreductase [Mammaliicoccus sciuri]MCD8770379.1 SDR family oxidoreductase [Mammaliicoccus sciuri]
MEFLLKEKTAFVTGATGGIGKSIVKKLLDNGANVVLAARSKDKLNDFAKTLSYDDKLLCIEVDVTSKTDIENAVKKAEDHFGMIDIFVNNAGKMGSSRILEGNVEDWEQMIDINIKGVLYGINAVLPKMREEGRGHIVNIASDSGFEVIERLTVYCATKFAVRAISIGLEKELSNTGVKVTNISPGMVETPLSSESPFEEGRKKLSPDDIAEAVVYATTQPSHVNVNEILVRPS